MLLGMHMAIRLTHGNSPVELATHHHAFDKRLPANMGAALAVFGECSFQIASHGERLLPYYFWIGVSAGHFTFGAHSTNTGSASIHKDIGRRGANKLKHAIGKLSDFPLSAVAAAQA